jgi:guanylate kinase
VHRHGDGTLTGDITIVIINFVTGILEIEGHKFDQVKNKWHEIKQVNPSEPEIRFKNRIHKEKSNRREKVMNRAIEAQKMWQ